MSSDTATDANRIHRCSACGHRVAEESASACPLCGFSFSFKDPRATGADITPYAKSYAHGMAGWRLMSEWVWLAGTERLKHLAMMRSSVASRRFARINIALLVIGLGVFQLSHSGWEWENKIESRDGLTDTVEPARVGWVHAASRPRPLPPDISDDVPIELWWSVPQAALATVIAVPVGVLLTWLALGLLRWMVTRAHVPPYRDDQRMTAALHYATAWVIPFSVGGLAFALRPISFIGRMVESSWVPPETAFVIAAAVVAGCSACAGWFWLARLGFTAQPASRVRVAAVLTLAPPIIGCGVALGWYHAVDALHGLLVEAFRLGF
jgi:hypothetical protein